MFGVSHGAGMHRQIQLVEFKGIGKPRFSGSVLILVRMANTQHLP
jgi:hypothetical protein